MSAIKRSNSPDGEQNEEQNKKLCVDPQPEPVEDIPLQPTPDQEVSIDDGLVAATEPESTAITAPSTLQNVDEFSMSSAWEVQPVGTSVENEMENDSLTEGTEEANDDVSRSEPEPIDHASNNSNQGNQSINSDSRDSLGREKDVKDRKQDLNEPDSPFEELFSTVMTATDEDGRSISQIFQLLPSKDEYPDYYKYIREPIDLKMIGTKIVSNAYATLIELEKDLMLMVKNAKYYNEPGSQVYKDANALRKIILSKKADIESRKYQSLKSSERIRARRSIHPSGIKWSQYAASLKYDDTSHEVDKSNTTLSEDDATNDGVNDSDPEDSDTNPMWQLIEYIRSVKDDEGLIISNPFMRLPSKRYYPDYYQEIKNPISLSQIQSRIKSNTYRTPQHLLDDLDTMYANAKKYNRPDSKIFENTCRLQKLTRVKSQELFSAGKEDEEEDDDDEEDDEDSIFSQSKLDSLKGEDTKSQASDVDFVIKKGALDESSLMNDESLDSSINLPTVGTPATGHSTSGLSVTIKKKVAKRLVTGYIIFASEVRKSVVARNPDCNFGEVSRIIGQEWKNLPTETRTEYEKKAQKQNEETQKESAREAAEHGPFSPSSLKQVIQNAVYECHWEHKCDYQCEDTNDLLEHITAEPNGHVWKSYADVKDQEKPIFQCLFYGCGRVKKGAAPFPNIARLIRHVKEVHVTKQNPKSIAPEKRGKNFHPSKTNPRPAALVPSDYGEDSIPASPSTSFLGPESNVYSCDWEHKCDFISEDSTELLEHLTGEPNGHVWKSYADVKDKEDSVFQCLFGGCGRVKKGATPFPSITRLIRHIKEIHVTKQTPKPVNSSRRISTYLPNKPATPLPVSSASVAVGQIMNSSLTVTPLTTTLVNSAILTPGPVSTNSVGVQAEPIEPLFMKPVTPRIAHSSVYLQYIERLKSDQRHVSNWEKQLNANIDNTSPEASTRLPVNCLANGAGVHSNMVEALWALRNFMFQDCLTLARSSNGEV